ncbi:Pycsar system effector family protein [Nonomuraea sp. NPDC047529]|uniref:Pycsar system effector family protein n=1 Tax=Nonomuraea sp. NPDC047529 TaxID=3155623 RepID=UPI0033F8D6F9
MLGPLGAVQQRHVPALHGQRRNGADMTTTSSPSFPGAPSVLARETDAVRAELARIDAKANTLLAFTLGWLTGLTALAVTGPHTGLVGGVALWAAGLLLAVAAVLLLRAVRPRIPRTGGTGFVAHARAASSAELLTTLAGTHNGVQGGAAAAADNLLILSKITKEKNDLIRMAIDIMLADLLVLGVTLPLILNGV